MPWAVKGGNKRAPSAHGRPVAGTPFAGTPCCRLPRCAAHLNAARHDDVLNLAKRLKHRADIIFGQVRVDGGDVDAVILAADGLLSACEWRRAHQGSATHVIGPSAFLPFPHPPFPALTLAASAAASSSIERLGPTLLGLGYGLVAGIAPREGSPDDLKMCSGCIQKK